MQNGYNIPLNGIAKGSIVSDSITVFNDLGNINPNHVSEIIVQRNTFITIMLGPKNVIVPSVWPLQPYCSKFLSQNHWDRNSWPAYLCNRYKSVPLYFISMNTSAFTLSASLGRKSGKNMSRSECVCPSVRISHPAHNWSSLKATASSWTLLRQAENRPPKLVAKSSHARAGNQPRTDKSRKLATDTDIGPSSFICEWVTKILNSHTDRCLL